MLVLRSNPHQISHALLEITFQDHDFAKTKHCCRNNSDPNALFIDEAKEDMTQMLNKRNNTCKNKYGFFQSEGKKYL